jgi:hypothetical protein
LNIVNGIIFAGFGGHCDQYNYTGWVIGMSTTGEYLTGYATSGGPNAPPQDGTWDGGGGGCGVWMAGMPLVSDNPDRLFFSTGNAYKVRDNGALPASGRLQLDTLSEAIVNLAVNATTGALTQQDYFETYQYAAMDAADRDLGSGGVILLDPVTFSGGGVSRVAIACGKNGNCYVTNADNLGGYKLGIGGGDAILQTLTPPSGGSFFGNPGSYPLEGGYIYLAPVGEPTSVYSLGFDVRGQPDFTFVAQTQDAASGRVGVGPATITTLKGQPGTGILWILDPDAGVRAYNAVPVNGQMIRIPLASSPSVSKYQRVVFGNGRYYLTTTAGTVNGYGSPVASPLTCNDPINFGSVPIGSTETLSVVCVANIPITSLEIATPYNSLYQVTNSSLPQGSLRVGTSFTFLATFNLTDSSSITPGIQSASITINTVNGAPGFSSQQPVSMTGECVSTNPFASIAPLQVDFPELVIGSAAAQLGSATTFNIQNIGQSNLTILGYGFTNSISNTVADTNVTIDPSANGTCILDDNGVFTSYDLPAVGTVINGGSSITVDVVFQTTTVGDYFSILQVFTNGGMVYTTLTGTADSSPIALLQQSSSEGGWITIPDCIDLTNGCTFQISMGSALGATQLISTIMFTNMGGSDLHIEKSKPLEGTILRAMNPTSDLYEGLAIAPGTSSSAAILFSPGVSVLNANPIIYSGTWTLNTDDLTFGTHTLNFTATLVAPQVGPLINGHAQFQYLGCYQDNVNIRVEQQLYDNVNNTNGLCQQQALAFGAVFAATEYTTECWVGTSIPSSSLLVEDSLCSTYLCSGDSTEVCGGIGGYMSLFYDITKYFPQNNTLAPSVQSGSSEPFVGPYSYLGCFVDSVASRALSGKTPGAQSINTLESCAAACNGYKYFGTEYSNECYCGSSLGIIAAPAADTDCKMICAGSKTEICGGSNRLSVYVLNSTAPVASLTSSSILSSTSNINPAGVPIVGAYVYLDCQTDLVADRTLTGRYTASSSMTVESCASFCAGYTFFGVEYSQECYCGNTFLASSYAATDGRCSMLCAGNSTETCGGPNGLSLYQLVSSRMSISLVSVQIGLTTTPSSSYSSASASSTLSSSVLSSSNSIGLAAPPTQTVAISCPTSNATIYTATNGDAFFLECYVDHTGYDLIMSYVNTYSLCAEACAYTRGCVAFSWLPPGPSSPCYMKNVVGTGNPKVDVWGARLVLPPSSAIVGSSSSIFSTLSSGMWSSIISSSSIPTTSNVGTTTILTTSFSVLLSKSSQSLSTSFTFGASDLTTSSIEVLPLPSLSQSSFLSIVSTAFSSGIGQSSSSSPQSLTYSIFLSSSHSSTSTNTSQTTMTSSTVTSTSTTSKTLLGSSTLSISNIYTASTRSTTSLSSGPTLSPWNYIGCANDSIDSRALSAASTTLTTMNITICQSYCKAANYPLAGVEYGTQCFCGSALAPGYTIGQSGCTMACGGNSSQVCGGSSRLSVYNNTAYIQPSFVPSVGSFNLKGCYSDSTAARGLNSYTWTSSTSMTVEACLAVCIGQKYVYAGLEVGGECFCGNTIAATSTLQTLAGCEGSFCNGNQTEFCGGPDVLLVYFS